MIGGAAGYGIRFVSEGGDATVSGNGDSAAVSHAAAKSPGSASASGAGATKAAGTSQATPGSGGLSLGDQMKELLVDFDIKSARKAAAKLSAGDLQAALALVAAMPKSADRDALRGQLYRAWAAVNPTAAWQAALADPLDKNKGFLLSAVAGEVAKTNPTEGINLALSLGMGGRRSTVMNAVFQEWSKVDVVAAIAYSKAHPDLPVDIYSFSDGISRLASNDPTGAANLVISFKDEYARGSLLTNLMGTWVSADPAAALSWAEALTNPKLRQDAIASALGAWAKNDPAAALAHVQTIPDDDTRINSFKKAWSDWFRISPADATKYLASTGDDKLLQSVGFTFSYLSESFSTKERAELLAQIPEGKAKEDMMRSVTDSQIRKGQYNQALELLNAMPDSMGRDRNVHQLGQEWAKADLAAATAWLKIQPDSSDRDLAVAGYTRTLARTDPASALEWVKSIPDAKVRDGAMKNIAVSWLRADAAKAEAWISTVPEFSESDKKMIQSMAGFRSDLIGLPVTVGTRR